MKILNRRKIALLDPHTINQIAAGEVVEGPVSCIKELIDNAVDAQASRIVIETRVGGRDYIRVSDNGTGMSEEDLLLSFERHATSKLSAISDLNSLATLGFRGEALSSIASVSKMEITTAEKHEDERGLAERLIGSGAQIQIEGGVQKTLYRGISCAFGTTIEIRDLFYNVPARRKFLRSPIKESADIYKMVQKLALAHPDVAFQLIVDGAVKCDFAATEQSPFFQRIEEILGKELAAQGVFFKRNLSDTASIEGFLGLPNIAKTTRNSQHILVNGRPIHSLSISYAVKSGYSTSIGSDQHPVFVLSLRLPPDEIDVNVHPQKREIRFFEEEALRRRIERTVAQELFAAPTTDRAESPPSFSNPFLPQAPVNPLFASPRPPASLQIDFLKKTPRELPPEATPETIQEAILKTPREKLSYTTIIPIPMAEEASPGSPLVLVLASDTSGQMQPTVLHIKNSVKAIHILRQMGSTLASPLASTSDRKSTEMLLCPSLLRFSQEEAALVEGGLQEFIDLGFSVRPFGSNTFIIDGVPAGSISGQMQIEHFFRDWIAAKEMREEASEPALESALTSADAKKEPLQKIFKKASLLANSLQLASLTETLSVDFFQYIVSEWIEYGCPAAALSGERLSLPLSAELLAPLFSSSIVKKRSQ